MAVYPNDDRGFPALRNDLNHDFKTLTRQHAAGINKASNVSLFGIQLPN
jgi:hypothetical protein